MERPLRRPEHLPEPRERAGVLVVATDVLELGRQPRKRIRDDAAMRLDTGAGARDEIFAGPVGACDADDRHVELPGRRKPLECREDVLESEVAARAKHDERVGSWYGHGKFSHVSVTL